MATLVVVMDPRYYSSANAQEIECAQFSNNSPLVKMVGVEEVNQKVLEFSNVQKKYYHKNKSTSLKGCGMVCSAFCVVLLVTIIRLQQNGFKVGKRRLLVRSLASSSSDFVCTDPKYEYDTATAVGMCPYSSGSCEFDKQTKKCIDCLNPKCCQWNKRVPSQSSMSKSQKGCDGTTNCKWQPGMKESGPQCRR